MQKGQTKLWSMIEQVSSTAIGFLVALVTQIVVFPLFDITTTFGDNFLIASIFTFVSIIRNHARNLISNSGSSVVIVAIVTI